MPDMSPRQTDNPEVARLLIAHEIASGQAMTAQGMGMVLDLDKYLEVFAKTYRGIYAVTSDPHKERGTKP